MAEQLLPITEGNFVQIFGTPIHPEFIEGHLARPHVFTAHWSAEVNGEYWMIFDMLRIGSQEAMLRLATKLNTDKDLQTAYSDPHFAVGPTFRYRDRDKGMKSVDDPHMGYTIYINRLPAFDPKNIERVHQLHI